MFYGPIHFDHVNPNGTLIPTFNPLRFPNPNTRGIYIWGFVYEFDKNRLTNPVDFTKPANIAAYKNNCCKLLFNWKFIPFYVGQKEGSIFDRIKEHHRVRTNASAKKYFRFTDAYMKCFFNDPAFPIRPTLPTIQPLIPPASIPSKLQYFNQQHALQAIYPGIIPVLVGTDCPITLQTYNHLPLPDTLDDLVNKMKNFWFCYMPLDAIANLNTFETFTFWALKGKTTSYTNAFEGLFPIITNPLNNPIFKMNNNNLVANNIFPGY